MNEMKEIVANSDYFPDELQNPDYLNLLRHEFIHIRLHNLCKKNINPTITSKRFMKDDTEWFECQCDLNFNYEIITITTFFRILISNIMSMFCDIIFYIMNKTYYLIKTTITDHSLTILFYLLKLTKKR